MARLSVYARAHQAICEAYKKNKKPLRKQEKLKIFFTVER